MPPDQPRGASPGASPAAPGPPVPLDATVARRMSRQRSRDTKPELELRRRLHARGLRYRVGVRPVPGLRSTPDVVFARARVAVYVDGCFWHRCPVHGTAPANNAAWWAEKLDRNVARDRAADARLAAEGWRVVRIWEHEAPDEAAARVEAAVRAGRPAG